MDHAIDVIRVQETQPCQDEYELAVSPQTSYHFSEMAKSMRMCNNNDNNFQQLSVPSELDLTEYEF